MKPTNLTHNASAVALATIFVMAGHSGAAVAQNDEAAAEEERALDVITVTGTRSALRDAIGAKRNADNFSDVIQSEDIGELPDANLAESLQRITGVQIIRDNAASREQISGQTVNIRGLPSLAILDGRTILSGSTSRDFDFRTLASEGFGSLVISKSPTPDRIEGGLGGTIELVSRSPLEFDERTFSITANAAYLEYADTTNPDLSAFYADQFLDGRLGFVVTASYEDLDTRTDAYTARGGFVVGEGYDESSFDADNDGTNDVILPSDIRYSYQNDQRERLGLNGTLAFAATDNLELSLTGNYSYFNREYFNGVLRAANFSAENAVDGSLVIDENGTLVAGTFENALLQSDGRLEVDEVETFVYGLNASWESDGWTVGFDIAQAEGSSEGRQLINRYRLEDSPTISFDYRNSTIPDLVVNGGQTDLTDPSLYRTDLLFNNPDFFDNDEFSSRIDVGYDLNMGVITEVSAGVRVTDANYKAQQFRQVGQSGGALLENPIVVDQATGEFITADNPALDPLLGGGFPVGDFFSGENGNFPTEWLYTSYPGGGLSGPGIYGDIYQLSPDVTENEGARTDINEQTFAAYFRADYELEIGGIPVRGNGGARIVQTDVESTAFQTQQDGSSELGTETNDYTELLPSFTSIAELNDDLLLRFAVGRVMRRPDITELRSSTSVNLSDLSGSAGNTQLDPFLANQVDLGLEWYFGDDSLLSGTLFYKDVENFIAVETETGVDLGLTGLDGGTEFTITRPINAGTAEIQGFEFSYQHAFTELPGIAQNLGMIANYTYTDVETSSGQNFPELSEDVINLIGYYDDGTIDFRLAYNWRSEYANNGDGSNGLQSIGQDEFVKAAGQLDLSANYSILENVDFLFEVLNITEENFERYSGIESRTREFRTGERRFNIGVRATF